MGRFHYPQNTGPQQPVMLAHPPQGHPSGVVPDFPAITITGRWSKGSGIAGSVSTPPADNETVENWTDSENSHVLTQATDGLRPTYDLASTGVDFEAGAARVLSKASAFDFSQDEDFTITFHATMDSNASTIRGMCEIFDDRVALFVSTGGVIMFSAVGAADHSTTKSWLDGETNCCTFVYDATADTVAFYFAGAFVETLSSVTFGASGLAKAFHLGSYNKFGLEWSGIVRTVVFQHQIQESAANIVQMQQNLLGIAI